MQKLYGLIIMKLKHIMVVGILLAILTVGAVSATDDVASDESLAVEEAVDDSIAEVDDSSEDELEENGEADVLGDYQGYSCNIWDVSGVYSEDFNNVAVNFVSENASATGELKVYVDNELRYSKNITSSDYYLAGDNKYHAYLGLSTGKLGIFTEGTYGIRVNLGDELLKESSIWVKYAPKVVYPEVVSVGEDAYIGINTPILKSFNVELFESVSVPGQDPMGVPIANITVVNGKGSYFLSGLSEGHHNFVVVYPDDVSTSPGYMSFDVKNNTPGFSYSANAKEILVGKTVTVTLKGPASNSFVAIYVDGEFFDSFNFSSGQVSQVISGLGVGTHAIQVLLYEEMENGKFYSNTIKVTVKSAAAPVKVTKKATKIVAAKKTFKKSQKIKKYTITLKSGKTLVKKVKVTLKVKGKKYTAKTNSKGKATFKITKLKKKGKFKATITFAGNSKYLKSSKKVVLKVK